MSVILEVIQVEDLQSSEAVQKLLESLEIQLSEAKDHDNKLVLEKIVGQLKTVQDGELEKLLDSLNWYKLLSWVKLCIEREAVSDEDRIIIAKEIAAWHGYYGGMAAGYGARAGVLNAVPKSRSE